MPAAQAAAPPDSTGRRRAPRELALPCGLPSSAALTPSSLQPCEPRRSAGCAYDGAMPIWLASPAREATRPQSLPASALQRRLAVAWVSICVWQAHPAQERKRAPRFCGSCARPVRASAAEVARLRGGLSRVRWRLLVCWSGHRAHPAECARSPRGRTRLLVCSAPCPDACRAWLSPMSLSPAYPSPPEDFSNLGVHARKAPSALATLVRQRCPTVATAAPAMVGRGRASATAALPGRVSW